MKPAPKPSRAPVVWIAGTRWDNVAATDRRLVEEVSRARTVLWVDPPVAAIPTDVLEGIKHFIPGANQGRGMDWVTDSVLRLRVPAPPGMTRFGIRSITALCLNRAIRSALATVGWTPEAVVVAFPLARFPHRVPGRHIYYVTDDWLAGADLMGFSRSAIRRAMTYNVIRSHVVAAVSDPLLEDVRALVTTRRAPRSLRQEFVVLPNGCPEPAVGTPRPRDKVAGLVGQLNERLDLEILEAVRSAGVRIRVIGPRTDRDPVFGQRLEAFLRSDNVEWTGALPADQIHAELARLGAGLTPYANSAFNRASFPLKTLEYLAAGVGVVATDIPAVQWLGTGHVAVASDTQDFVRAVVETLGRRGETAAEMHRRGFARRHTWQARGSEFNRLLSDSNSLDGNGRKVSHDW